jgi:DNA helicase-2/ATP-dependent DNA helicase PcrA
VKIGINQKVLLGPPGTGKTTSLMTMIEEALNSGIQPEEIAFVSFTKKAVMEATERACSKFNFPRTRFPLFQTVHALCFKQLGLSKNAILNKQNYIELGEWLGYDLSSQYHVEDGAMPSGSQPGDKLLFLDNIARVKCVSVRSIWQEIGEDSPWEEQERFSLGYAKYREKTGLLDFTDLLHKFVEEGSPTNAKIAFVDEAQDLSKAQWLVLEKCFSEVSEVVIAGDDDQSIFKWSGADLDTFLTLGGEKVVLDHSYRLPVSVYRKASNIIQQVRNRYEKKFTPTERLGSVDYVGSLDQVSISENESTLILVRNVYLLNPVYDRLKQLGLVYNGRNNLTSVKSEHVDAIRSWERMRKGFPITISEAKIVYDNLRIGSVLARGGKVKLDNLDDSDDLFTWETLRDHYGLLSKPIWNEGLEGISLETREYYTSVLRSKRKISQVPKVHVNTIHGVKGGEAQHVIIISDMSKRTYTEMLKDYDSEHRVAFVALTRAIERVTIVMPQGKFSYPY